MPATLKMEGDTLIIGLSTCRGMEFKDSLEKIKDIPGRRWDPDGDGKPWLVPATVQNADRILKTLRPTTEDDTIQNWILASKVSAEENLTSPLPDDAEGLAIEWAYKRAPWQPEYVNDEKVVGLLPPQRAAVKAIAERTRAILADDMGLGKTLQAISAVEEYALRNGQLTGPKLIVAPKSVKGSWARELNRWLEDPTVVVLEGSNPKKRSEALAEAIEANAWVIVNWEQLRTTKIVKTLRNGGTKKVVALKEPLLGSTEWLAVIADEAHRAKNHKALQTQGLWRINGQIMVAATGTPIMNSPNEIWSLLRWLWPDQYHETGARRNAVPYWEFYEAFVDYYEDFRQKKIITGVKNPDALRFALKDKLIRRLRPAGGLARVYEEVPLNPGQLKVYKEAEKQMWLEVTRAAQQGDMSADEFEKWKDAADGGDLTTLWNLPNGAAKLVRLQQIIENTALLGGEDDSAIMDDLEQKIEDSGGEPWVFFFKFVESCNIFAERLRKKGLRVGVYTGETPGSQRTKMEDDFQAGELDAVVGTIGAMKEGITLTRSHLGARATESFVPAEDDQCEARLDRLGQQQHVLFYVYRTPGTVATSKVQPILELKRAMIKTVVPTNKVQEDYAS